jgi:AraC family transcriptional activator of pobA
MAFTKACYQKGFINIQATLMNRNLQENISREHLTIEYDSLTGFSTSFGTASQKISATKSIYILLFVAAGDGYCFVNDKKIILSTGTLVVVHPYATLHLSDTVHLEGSVILFEECFFCRKSQQEQYLQKTLFSALKHPAISIRNYPVIQQYIMLQLEMFKKQYQLRHQNILRPEILHNILQSLIIFINLKFEAFHTDILYSPKSRERVMHFILLVQQHFKEERLVHAYAEKLHISTNRLNLICKEEISISPKDFLNRKLLNEAKRLLLFEAKTIKDASKILGFKQVLNFTNFYEKQTGSTPWLLLAANEDILQYNNYLV